MQVVSNVMMNLIVTVESISVLLLKIKKKKLFSYFPLADSTSILSTDEYFWLPVQCSGNTLDSISVVTLR